MSLYPIAPEAKTVMSRLSDHGYEAYLVGGYVRNRVLGRPVTDLDITTNASTSTVLALFTDHKTSRIGERMGTIGIKVHHAWVEVTTYRIDSPSSNARHPDAIAFTGSLIDDLKRRDFTINALVLDQHGRLSDPIGGLADLNAGIIRAIGNPDERFNDDALRILRALRFGAQLGFSIDHDTGQALLRHQALLDSLPVERIRTELDKLIAADSLETIFYPFFEVLARCMAISPQGLAGFEQFEAVELKLLTLLEHLSPQALHDELLRLKYPKRFCADMAKLAALRLAKATTPRQIKYLLHDYGLTWVNLAMTYQDVKAIEGIDPDLTAKVLSQNPIYSLKHLAINGDDVVKRGVQGPAIQRLLDRLLIEVMDERLPNDRNALLGALDRLLDEKA
jgi:tRNA nucleotidyltransferase (CCA-adding enzyme)